MRHLGKIPLMYEWRKMTPEDRLEVMHFRSTHQRPWHSPPHFHSRETSLYLFTASCFNHAAIVGHSPDRMQAFEEALLETAEATCSKVFAWVVLPNHYHFLAETSDSMDALHQLGLLHGRTSHSWNGEEDRRGRQVWCNATKTAQKSESHFWASMNYVHHNPVKHGYVSRWQDWPFSSAHQYLDKVGEDTARRIWRDYPIQDYGKAWDD